MAPTGWVVQPRPATAEETRKRLHSLTLAGRIGKLGYAQLLGQVTDEEAQERKRLLDLLDGFGWRADEPAMTRCRSCTGGDHEHCTTPLTGGPAGGFMLGCCCDLLDDPGVDLEIERRLEARHFDDDDPADV
jgi:hypothetical protein